MYSRTRITYLYRYLPRCEPLAGRSEAMPATASRHVRRCSSSRVAYRHAPNYPGRGFGSMERPKRRPNPNCLQRKRRRWCVGSVVLLQRPSTALELRPQTQRYLQICVSVFPPFSDLVSTVQLLQILFLELLVG